MQCDGQHASFDGSLIMYTSMMSDTLRQFSRDEKIPEQRLASKDFFGRQETYRDRAT